MTDFKHTPEPWKIAYEKGSIYIEDVETMLNQVVVFKYGQMEGKDEANAARIVECVNALAGIENPKEWVDKIKQSFLGVDITNALIGFLTNVKNEGKPFTSRIQMFNSKMDCVDIVLWASMADVCDSPIKRIVELRKELTECQAELVKTKDILKKLESTK